MTEKLYKYVWGNNKNVLGRWRLRFKGRKCKILARGSMNSRYIVFLDTGETLNCSGNALRKA